MKVERLYRSWIKWRNPPWWSGRGSPSSLGWAWPSCPRSAGDLSDLSASPYSESAGFSVSTVPAPTCPAGTPIQSSWRSLYHLEAEEQRRNTFTGGRWIRSKSLCTGERGWRCNGASSVGGLHLSGQSQHHRLHVLFQLVVRLKGRAQFDRLQSRVSQRPTPTTRHCAASIPPHHLRRWLQVTKSSHKEKFSDAMSSSRLLLIPLQHPDHWKHFCSAASALTSTGSYLILCF